MSAYYRTEQNEQENITEMVNNNENSNVNESDNKKINANHHNEESERGLFAEPIPLGGEVRNQDDIETITAELTGHNKDVVKSIVNAFWDTICRELEYGNTIKLHGKGRFYLSKRSARMGRNPSTGEEYPVPEREAMAFQTSPAYAKRLRERREKIKALQTELKNRLEQEEKGKSQD